MSRLSVPEQQMLHACPLESWAFQCVVSQSTSGTISEQSPALASTDTTQGANCKKEFEENMRLLGNKLLTTDLDLLSTCYLLPYLHFSIDTRAEKTMGKIKKRPLA